MELPVFGEVNEFMNNESMSMESRQLIFGTVSQRVMCENNK